MEVCNKLMVSLGYSEYVCQGGDWGSLVSSGVRNASIAVLSALLDLPQTGDALRRQVRQSMACEHTLVRSSVGALVRELTGLQGYTAAVEKAASCSQARSHALLCVRDRRYQAHAVVCDLARRIRSCTENATADNRLQFSGQLRRPPCLDL